MTNSEILFQFREAVDLYLAVESLLEIVSTDHEPELHLTIRRNTDNGQWYIDGKLDHCEPAEANGRTLAEALDQLLPYLFEPEPTEGAKP